MSHRISKNGNDRRLIEDYLPIEAISAEARREKSVRKGHISTLHLWWARRPLVASRAAVFGALAPAKAKLRDGFVEDLCQYPGSRQTINEAEDILLQAHAERLTKERGELVTVEDVRAGRAPRPRVLDMFAGGGAIPLEALRLGCEAYALDLNPVAHLIELCTLVYPQQYGQPDPATRGSAPDGSWAGLAAEVEHWGNWVLERVKAEIGDLYPPIPDPEYHKHEGGQLAMGDVLAANDDGKHRNDKHMLTPVAYLWTRTVRCSNPACGGIVPLARQTWLAKKKRRFVALKPDAETNKHLPPGDPNKRVRYTVVEVTTEAGLNFDPAAGSKGGNVVCPFCGTVIENKYVREEGKAGRIDQQLMVVVCTQSAAKGKRFISADEVSLLSKPRLDLITEQIERISGETGLTAPNEPIRTERPSANARGLSAVTRYGVSSFADLFTPRQTLTILSFIRQCKRAHHEMMSQSISRDHAKVVGTYLAVLVDRILEYTTSFSRWDNTQQRVVGIFGRQALPMIWDFAELIPLGQAVGSWTPMLKACVRALLQLSGSGQPCNLSRGTATDLPYPKALLDAVISDPPYYDNVPYSDLSDFFYVWLQRSVGYLYPEHFSAILTPKRNEVVADAARMGGQAAAMRQYESMMAQAFAESVRVLKPNGVLVIVYAHKTTLGWATLVDALRRAGCIVTEAWPLDTEQEQRLLAMDSAALASSIFIVARRRENDATGNYETDVRPDLENIVRERVETLWAKGITGADLVIACVGAGLRAFTRYARVEYANGEEVPAEKFLSEVEGVVLDTLLAKLFGVRRSGVSSVDPTTRFYVLWRYAYRSAAIAAGEAIVFAYPQGVELDGPRSLSYGADALVEKRKNQYRLRDFTERGAIASLGLPGATGPAPLIDALHRAVWLMENAPSDLADFLDKAQPDTEQMRVVAQTLAGPALSGGESAKVSSGSEAAALRKLTTNWQLARADRG